MPICVIPHVRLCLSRSIVVCQKFSDCCLPIVREINNQFEHCSQMRWQHWNIVRDKKRALLCYVLEIRFSSMLASVPPVQTRMPVGLLMLLFLSCRSPRPNAGSPPQKRRHRRHLYANGFLATTLSGKPHVIWHIPTHIHIKVSKPFVPGVFFF